MNVLKRERQAQIVSMLVEGNSIRSIERITGTHRDTIMRLLVRVGDHCDQIMQDRMQGLRFQYVQCDEIWCYVQKKQRCVLPDDPAEYGSTFTFVALDQDSKLVPAYLVGKRDAQHTDDFIRLLSQRLRGHVQISTDGWTAYPGSIFQHFNGRSSYGQIVKDYRSFTTDEAHRYSPPGLSATRRIGLWGGPRLRYVSTSHIERQNLTMRMQMRRFTRLTNAFSKKLDNLRAAAALHFVWYNFCRRHAAHDLTPAVAAGVASEKWPIERLIAALG